MTGPVRDNGSYASPPCLAHELDEGYFDPLAVDPQQAADVARWRRAERQRLRRMRTEIPAAARPGIEEAICRHLHDVLVARRARLVSLYWPIKGEPDLRGLMAELHDAGIGILLPVVETVGAPLVFRRWTPDTRMQRGHWNIPVPPPSAPVGTPETVIAPLLGWDAAGYRLGYGGGYFDRTLAALSPRPFAIGVGLAAARLATIFPQPHDVPMTLIVTEDGVVNPEEPAWT